MLFNENLNVKLALYDYYLFFWYSLTSYQLLLLSKKLTAWQ